MSLGGRRRFTTLAQVSDERPILALDVDGVISLFGFEGPPQDAPAASTSSTGSRTASPTTWAGASTASPRRYEVVWATGWEDRANERLPQLLGLDGELPYLTFDGNARFGSAHWKIEPIDRYAGDRPLAWIDDCLDESCHSWAASRSAPTLLVPTEPFTGLTEELVDALLRWVDGGYTQP